MAEMKADMVKMRDRIEHLEEKQNGKGCMSYDNYIIVSIEYKIHIVAYRV